MIDYLLVIPARYGSKRFPGKPLLNIKGIPMIIRTFNQCNKVVPRNKIIVATDDKRIEFICKKIILKQSLLLKNALQEQIELLRCQKKLKKIFILTFRVMSQFVTLQIL